jgi:hypothetical protein
MLVVSYCETFHPVVDDKMIMLLKISTEKIKKKVDYIEWSRWKGETTTNGFLRRDYSETLSEKKWMIHCHLECPGQWIPAT